MYYELYIDQFAAEQFLIGYLLLSVCVRLQRRKVSKIRIAAGSLGNTVLSVLSVCIGRPHGALAGIFLAGMIVFGMRPLFQFWKDLRMLLFLTVCFAGSLELILGMIPVSAAAGSIAAVFLVRKGWEIHRRQGDVQGQLLKVKLYQKEQILCLQAIWDTGNQLQEPFTGKPVSIVEESAAKGLLKEGWEMEKGYFLIPYHSLGTRKSWMRGITIDKLEVLLEDQTIQVKRPVLGLYKGKVSSAGRYQVILHPDHMK